MQNIIFQIIKPQVLEIRDLQVKGEEEKRGGTRSLNTVNQDNVY